MLCLQSHNRRSFQRVVGLDDIKFLEAIICEFSIRDSATRSFGIRQAVPEVRMYASKLLRWSALSDRVLVQGTVLESAWIILGSCILIGARLRLFLLLLKSFLLLLFKDTSCGIESCLVVTQRLVGGKECPARLSMAVEDFAMTDTFVLELGCSLPFPVSK